MTAYTPNLPALITALPGDATRAPQTEFDRAHRSTPAFRTAWDGALVVARVAVADTVGCRAIDGIVEPVFYHGEEVATRTRYSDRLLLAHLARLDKLAETPAAAAFAQDWDEAVARFARGEAQAAPEPEFFAPGPCNTRSMSQGTPSATPQGPSSPELAGEGAVEEPVPAATNCDAEALARVCAGESADEARLPRVDRLLAAMARARPRHAPDLPRSGEGSDVEAWQVEAFCEGVADWWRVVALAQGPAEDGWPDDGWQRFDDPDEEEWAGEEGADDEWADEERADEEWAGEEWAGEYD